MKTKELAWELKPTGDKRYDIRFKYLEAKDGNKTWHQRITKVWWMPFEWLGNRRWIRYNWFGHPYGKWHWWVRKNLTFD